MDEQVIDDLYNRAVSKGYKKSRQEFVGLLHSDADVMNDMYSYVQSKGYKKGVDDFKNLVGATAQEPTILQKKNVITESPLGAGSSASSASADPEALRFGKLAAGIKKPTPQIPPSYATSEQFKKDLVEAPIKKAKEEKELAESQLSASNEFEKLGEKPKVEQSKYLNEQLVQINKDLVGKTEEFVVPEMEYRFGKLGFKFEEAIGGRDYMNVTAPNGEKTQISLDNFLESTSASEALRLQKFMQDNTPMKGLFVLEKTLKDQDKTFSSQKEVDIEAARINDEATTLNKKQKDFLLRKDLFEKEVEEFNKTPESQWGTPEFIKKATELESRMEALNNELPSILSEEESLTKKASALDRSVGSYVSTKAKQGTWYGGIGSEILAGGNSILADAFGRFIDISTEVLPTGMGMGEDFGRQIAETKVDKIGAAPPAAGQSMDAWKKSLTEKQLDAWEDEVDDAKKKFQKKDLIPASRESLQTLSEYVGVDRGASPEWINLTKEGFWGGAILGLARSLPAMAGRSNPIGWVQRTSQMYAQVSDGLMQEMEKDPAFAEISESEKAAIIAPIGLVSSVLEAYGLRNVLQSKGIITSITMSALGKAGKGASYTSLRELAENEIKSRIAKGVLVIGAAGLAEAETGVAQQLAETGFKAVYNKIKEEKLFQTPESVGEVVKEMVYAGAQEAVGGFILGVPNAVSVAYSKKGFLKMDDATFEAFENMANDGSLQSAYIISLKEKIASGKISASDAKEELQNYRTAVGVYRQIPDGLTLEQKKEAMNLLKERKDLEQFINGKDVALVSRQKNRIAEINDELSKISEQGGAQKIQSEANEVIAQREAKIAELSKAIEDDDTATELNLSTKLPTDERQRIEKQLQDLKEEKDAVQEQAAGQVSVQPTTTVGQEVDNYMQKIINGSIKVPFIDERTGVQEEVTTKIPEPKTTAAFADELSSKYGVELELQDNETDNSISVPKIVVPKDQRKTGIGTKVMEEIIEFADRSGKRLILTPSTSFGGSSVKRLVEFYKSLGFVENKGKNKDFTIRDSMYRNPVPVAQEAAVVSPAVSPLTQEQQMASMEQMFSEEKIPAATSNQGVSVTNKSAVDNIKTKTADKQRVKVIESAQRVLTTLKSVLPNFDIILHDDDGSFNAAMDTVRGKKDTRGNFFINEDGSGRIDINLSRANNRTVAHEVAHAVMAKAFNGSPELYKSFRDKISKVLNESTNKKLMEFSSKYKQDVTYEEYLAELTAILEQEESSLSVNTLQKIAAIINNVVSKLTNGKFKPFQDVKETNDLIDFFNSTSTSIRLGEEIELNGGGEVGTFNFGSKSSLDSKDAPSSSNDSRSFIRDLVNDVDMTDFNGKKFITNMYDYTNAGITDLGNGLTINMLGGKNYVPYMMSLQDKKIGDVSNLAAFNNKAQAESFARNAIQGQASLFAPHSGTLSESWQFQQHTFAELVNLIIDKNIMSDSELIDVFNKTISSNKDNKKAFDAFKTKAGKDISNFDSFKNNPKKIVELLDIKNNYSPNLRKALNNAISADKTFQKAIGIKNKEEFFNKIIDPLNQGVQGGEIINVVEFDPNTFQIVQTKAGAIDHHPSFGWSILAKINGIYQPTQFYNSSSVTDSYVKYNKSGEEVSRKAEESNFTKKNVSSSAGSIPKVAEFNESVNKEMPTSKAQLIGKKANLSATVKHNFNLAKEMDKLKESPINIRLETGWEKGKDGEWRYEIPDGKFKDIDLDDLKKKKRDTKNVRVAKLGDIFIAPDLYDAYPKAKEIKIVFEDLPDDELGGFNRPTQEIIINTKYYNNNREVAELTMLHEIQHYIQTVEIFESGSNPALAKGIMKYLLDDVRDVVRKAKNVLDFTKDFYKDSDNKDSIKRAKLTYDKAKNDLKKIQQLALHKDTKEEKARKIAFAEDASKKQGRKITVDDIYGVQAASAYNLYYRIAGEVEARNIEYRAKLTPEQRRKTLLSETENIDRADQILNDYQDLNLQEEVKNIKKELPVSKSQLNTDAKANKVVQQARAQGFSEDVIRLFLQGKGISEANINKAMGTDIPAAGRITLSEETIRGYDSLMKKLENLIVNGMPLAEVISKLKNSKAYIEATDVQKEKLVREVRKMGGVKEKSAPRSGRLIGIVNDITKITMTEKEVLNKRIKDLAEGAKDAVKGWRKITSDLAKEIKALAKDKSGKLTARQVTSVTTRLAKLNAFNEQSVKDFVDYMAKVFDNANYAADMTELRKLQKQAKRKKHTSMKNLVDSFTSINPELIPLDRIQEYKKALDFLNNLTPFYGNMNEMLADIESYKKVNKFDAVKTKEALQEKYKSIKLNEVKNVEEYRNLIKDINSFKRKAAQLLENGDINQEKYDEFIELVSTDQAKVEENYKDEITKIKKDLIAEIKKQRPKVSRDFSNVENDLIRKYLELSDADLQSLSPEELFILNDLLENISNGEIDVSRFGPIVSKAYTSDGANKLTKQIDDSKFDMTPEEGMKELSEYESSFWEGLLGMGRAKSGALQKFVVSVFNRAIASYENLTRNGYNEFLKLKNRYKMSDKDMHKLGILTTYLQEYMAQFDSNNEGIKDIGKRDWFKEILSSKSMRGKYSSGKPSILKVIGLGKSEIDIIEEIWNSLPKDKDGNVDPKAVYDSYMANDGKFFTKKQKAFFDDVMEYKESEITPKQKFANELSGASFKEIPFHMMRVRLDGGKTQITPTASSDNGVVRIKAGTGKERVSEAVGPIMTNFEKLFIKNLEQTSRDYFLSGALKDINNTLSGAKKKINPDKMPLLDTISGTLSEALGYEFDKTQSNFILRALLSARAAQTLLRPIRTVVELFSSLGSYPVRAKTVSGYKSLFGEQGAMKKLLEFTNSPMLLRENISKAIDINDGRIEPQGRFTKATNYLSGLPERTMMVTSWMPTFKSEFKTITGIDFEMKKFNDSEAYREKYGKAIRESSAAADAQTEKIIGPTTKAGQRREVRIAPRFLANLFGAEGTVSKNTTEGQILGFFSNYPYRELTEFINGFREAAEVLNDEGALSSLSQLQKPLGVALNVAAYSFLSSATYALSLMLLGDDDDEERGEDLLKVLLTGEGLLEELKSNAISLAGSRYAAGGKALIQLAATILIESTDDEEQKAKIKKLLKDSIFIDPLPVDKAIGFKGEEEVAGAIGKFIPQFIIAHARYADFIGTLNEVEEIYDKVKSKGVDALTEDESLKVLALNTLLNVTQIVLNVRGTSIPEYNYIKTYMKKLKEEAGVAEVYKGEAPAKKKSSGGGGGRAKTINKSDLKRYYPELSRQIESATGEIEQEVKAFEKEQRELKKKMKDELLGGKD